MRSEGRNRIQKRGDEKQQGGSNNRNGGGTEMFCCLAVSRRASHMRTHGHTQKVPSLHTDKQQQRPQLHTDTACMCVCARHMLQLPTLLSPHCVMQLMQLCTMTGMSVSVSCCWLSVSPPLPAATWMAAHQPAKSNFLSPSIYRVLNKETGNNNIQQVKEVKGQNLRETKERPHFIKAASSVELALALPHPQGPDATATS